LPRDEYGLPESMEALDGLSDEDVLARYNRVAGVSSSFQRDELRFWRTEWGYRLQGKVAKTMKRLTWAIFAFTLLVAAFTVLLYVHPLT
jgi:hypothetical protein